MVKVTLLPNRLSRRSCESVPGRWYKGNMQIFVSNPNTGVPVRIVLKSRLALVYQGSTLVAQFSGNTKVSPEGEARNWVLSQGLLIVPPGNGKPLPKPRFESSIARKQYRKLLHGRSLNGTELLPEARKALEECGAEALYRYQYETNLLEHHEVLAPTGKYEMADKYESDVTPKDFFAGWSLLREVSVTMPEKYLKEF